MRKFIFIITVSFLGLILNTANSQNSIRIYSSDTTTISKFWKIKTPRTGFDNAYFQLTYYSDGQAVDFRNLNVYRIINNLVTYNMHNSALRNYFNLCSFPFSGIAFGGAIDFTFSERDSNLFLESSSAAECEPYEGLGYTFNNGTTFNSIFPMGFMRFIPGFAINPSNDSIMYAFYRVSETFCYKSTNRGSNWFITDTIPNTIRGVMKVNPFNSSIVFFGSGSVLYRSTSGGYDFSPVIISNAGINSIEFDSLGNCIYLTSNTGSSVGIFKSDPQGLVWTKIFDKVCHTLEIDPANNNTLYAGTNEGIYKSTNAGVNWTLYNNGFAGSKSVIGLVKNPDMGDTIITVTAKNVYKVFGPFQTFTDYNYFPLKIGNSWIYKSTFEGSPSGKRKITIISDTVISNIRYYKTNQPLPTFLGKLITLDSLTGNVYEYYNNFNCPINPNRILVDSLSAKKGDTINSCGGVIKGRCLDTSNITLFGTSIKSKTFLSPFIFTVDNVPTYAKGFGITSASITEGTGGTDTLIGCVIDGVMYGDTTLPVVPEKTYLPLNIGNKWAYKVTTTFFPDPPVVSFNTVQITGDTIINNIKYFKTSQLFPSFTSNLVTLDSMTGNVFCYKENSSCTRYPNRDLIDSLSCSIGDTIHSCPQGTNGIGLDTNSVTLFGQTLRTKNFSSPYWAFNSVTHRYANNLGIINAHSGENFSVESELRGCFINGTLYGDTNIALLNTISGIVRFSDNNQTASEGYVKALKLNPQTRNIITYDSVQIHTEGSYILHIPSDLFYIVAYPNSEKQSDFVPTYYPSTINWQNAVRINSAGNPSNINISVFRKESGGGIYSVDGMIMQETNNASGIKDAIVYMKQGNAFKGFFITPASGQYILNNLSSGSYKVITDRLGYESAEQNVSLTNSNLSNINFVLIHVGIQNISNIIPEKFYLYQNYPNPFNPTTNIKFDIPKSSMVSLKIYNVLGKEVGVLLNEIKPAGSYMIDFDASAFSSGVYFYRIETETFTETKRMIILK